MATAVQSAGEDQRAVAANARLGDAVTGVPWTAGWPLIVRPTDPTLRTDASAVARWFAEHQAEIDHVLADYGAIMFRDFALDTTLDFAAAMESYPAPPGGYSGGATPREAVAGRVFEATRTPADSTIVLHQEMAYLPRWPRKLAFYCLHAPDTGGETLISSVRRFERAADQRFIDQIRERGLLTTRNFRSPGPAPEWLMSVHRPWQEAFYTEDPAKAESDIEEMGLDYKWEDDGSLTASFRHDGFMDHHLTGQRHWFNQLLSQTFTPYSLGERWQRYADHYADGRPQPYGVRFGDGGAIPIEDVNAMMPLLNGETIAVPWQHADILMIDNILTFHGRNSYTGHRDVQVALLEEGAQ
jgi:alpha-ketoglutarate-dependent taurine dioxygenase